MGSSLTPVAEATRRYERWLRQEVPTVAADFDLKHKVIAEAPFPFMRGTFYRWIEAWPVVCREWSRATSVAAVGDLHIENFGTWRDVDGRLAWGVNDFDEAHVLPFTIDLVRLATSALLAVRATHLEIAPGVAIERLLDGYRTTLADNGRPFVLEEHHEVLREMAMSELRSPARFWEKLQSGREVRGNLPRGARKALERLLPPGVDDYRIRRRVAGIGSLGKCRLVAIATWRGGLIAREAKARAPSACVWGGSKSDDALETILSGACRPKDPLFLPRRRWMVRRLSPHCSRIELESLRKTRDEKRLLHAMGAETANVHLASDKRRQIGRDLNRFGEGWLADAAEAMLAFVEGDFKDWSRSS